MADLGAFSISLSVKDLAKSKAFYLALGFSEFGGDESQNWLILKNGTTTIGLFQDMFESNILTFNPGWNADAEELEKYTDVRQIQARALAADIEVANQIEEDSVGPASFSVQDPDGNTILFDQHR